MSTNYSQFNYRKLRSPLLGGEIDNRGFQDNESTEFKEDPTNEFNFNSKDPIELLIKNNYVNHNAINSLENLISISSILITSTGGILCLLELVSIFRGYQANAANLEYNITIFVSAFIGTLLANTVCTGFLNIIKVLKQIQYNSELQNKKIDFLLKTKSQ